MNRREAIADLKPDDVLVVETDAHISAETAERIKATMGQVWPGRKVAVFDGGMRLKVVSAEAVEGAGK